MAVLLALGAAVAFALGSVLQQRGTLETKAGEGDPHFLVEILREPVWFAGAACQLVGWVLQAVALARGPLVVVQSLCALSLVFALPLGARLTDQQVDRRTVAGAALALAGIVVFLVIGQPGAGTTTPSASAWWWSGVSSAVLIGGLVLVGRRRGGPAAAALLAGAAGVAFAYQAAVTKVFVGELGHGLGPVLTSWTTYALIVTALGGFALQQTALKTGHLAPALAASNAATLLISVVLGVRVFDEALSGAAGHVPLALGALAAAAIGIVVLASPRADSGAAAEPGGAAGP